ncbi:MAG: DotH/IcmK family type IV secretion protein [Gammaproteobacteria bacterium]
MLHLNRALYLGLLFSVNVMAANEAATLTPLAQPSVPQGTTDQTNALTPYAQLNNNTNQNTPPLNLPPAADANNPNGYNNQAQNQNQNQNQALPYGGNLPPEVLLQQLEMMQPEATPRTFGTINDPAFQNVLKKQFPLTPEQILKLKEVMQDTQRATATNLQPPTPTVSSQTVSLSPGTVPPVIRLATGYVSSIVFVDETGAPWPIVGYSIGNPSAFNVQWDQKSNVLMMQGVGVYQSGNLAVQLAGLSMPVMLTIVNDQKIVDYRMDLRLQGRGPNAQAPLIGNAVPGAGNPLLLNLLEGVPPSGSETLSVTGGEAQAWLYNNMMYLRTRLTVLSPGWSSTMTSPDGMKVYELNVTPMILASDQGQTVTLRVEGL